MVTFNKKMNIYLTISWAKTYGVLCEGQTSYMHIRPCLTILPAFALYANKDVSYHPKMNVIL